MSKLQLLALQKKLKNTQLAKGDQKIEDSNSNSLQNTAIGAVPTNKSNGSLTLAEKLNSLKGISISQKTQFKTSLESLPQIQSNNSELPEKVSLAERLKMLRAANVKSSGQSSDSYELKPSSALQLNKKMKEFEELPSTSVKERKSLDQSHSKEKSDLWKLLLKQQHITHIHTDKNSFKPSTMVLGNLRKNNDIIDVEMELTRKRHYEEIFTVFYPNKKNVTNKQTDTITAKKKALQNFQKPSPDDVVLEAQAKVFGDVQKNIEQLDISKNPKLEGDWEERKESETKDEQTVITYVKATEPTKPSSPIDLEKVIHEMKPHCTFVVLGHVDAGKSTLMGRLLYDIGAVDSNLVRKLKRESERIGKGSFHLAWLMDQTTEERERGVTVTICTSDFETDNARFTIVDAPGHQDFVPNAIAGISQADVAVLTIDCGTDAFESGFNLNGQTKEHALLARSMGVQHLIVAMNKMDSIDWYEGRFNQIKNELLSFLEVIGFKSSQISWVPCNGLSGEGVHLTPYPELQNWYFGSSLIKTLEDVASKTCTVTHAEIMNEPFLFSILEVTPSKKHEEAIISGRVEAGSIQPGETITIYPSEQSVLVDRIVTGNVETNVQVAIKNDFVTLKLRHAHPEDIEGGDLAASVEYAVAPFHSFKINILTFGLDRPILPGTSLMMFRGVCEQPARVEKLLSLVDKHDITKIVKKKVRHLSSNQSAVVEIDLVDKKKWIPMLTYAQNKHLGRVVLRKDGKTIGAGIIVD